MEPLTRVEPDERQKAFNKEVFALIDRHQKEHGLSPIEQLAVAANIVGCVIAIQGIQTPSDVIQDVVNRNIAQGIETLLQMADAGDKAVIAMMEHD